MGWECRAFDEGRLTVGKRFSRIDIGNEELVEVSNKLVKRKGGYAFLVFKPGFEFQTLRAEYGRFGRKRIAKAGTMSPDGLFRRIMDLTEEAQIELPKVTGVALEELLDE